MWIKSFLGRFEKVRVNDDLEILLRIRMGSRWCDREIRCEFCIILFLSKVREILSSIKRLL